MLQHIEATNLPATHPVAAFSAIWMGCRKSASDLPAASHAIWHLFDPIDFPKVLPWILLMKPDGSGGYDCVVCGGRCQEIFGFNYQGKKLGEGLPADAYADRQKEFQGVIDSRDALYSETQLPIPDRDFITVYRGVFPFFEEDGSLARIAVVISPVNEKI